MNNLATDVIKQMKQEKLMWKVICIMLSALLLLTNAFWIGNKAYENERKTGMVIYDFTEPELEHFRKTCNFTQLERDVFEMRAKGISIEDIAERLDYSPDYIKKISQKVNRKIIKVI